MVIITKIISSLWCFLVKFAKFLRQFLYRTIEHLQVNANFFIFQPFKRQYHKMIKHTQTIRPQFADELFERV